MTTPADSHNRATLVISEPPPPRCEIDTGFKDEKGARILIVGLPQHVCRYIVDAMNLYRDKKDK